MFSYLRKHVLWVLIRSRCASNEYHNMCLCGEKNRKNNEYPCEPQFYYMKKWGLRGSKFYRRVFVMMLHSVR